MAWHTEVLLARKYIKTQAINDVQKVCLMTMVSQYKSQTIHVMEMKQLLFQANRQVFLHC